MTALSPVHARAVAALGAYAARTPAAVATPFDRVVPRRPLAQWFPLVAQYKIATDETVLAALALVERVEAAGVPVSSANALAVFAAALTVAHKFQTDSPFDNLTFARLAEISLAQANAVELELLERLHFDVAPTE